MKKIIYALVILQTTAIFSMDNASALTIGALPVMLPAAYYWKKNLKNTCPAKDTWRPFVEGATFGLMPILNIAYAAEHGTSFLHDWANHARSFTPRSKATTIGFLSGLSLYVTIPLAIAAAKKNGLKAAVMKPKL